jgi:hypothetical protein
MTSNGFQFFEGSRTETKTPQVTVRRSGQMVLMRGAAINDGPEITLIDGGPASEAPAPVGRAC